VVVVVMMTRKRNSSGVAVLRVLLCLVMYVTEGDGEL
jgi:hypothetical protein